LPSISGKTIGTGSFIEPCFVTVNNFTSSATIDYWGVQVEYGSKATPFQTASGGSPQAELAMCQRYYYRADGASNQRVGAGHYINTTSARIIIPMKQTMRVTPSFTASSAAQWVAGGSAGGDPTPSTLVTDTSNTDNVVLNATNTGTSIYVANGYGTLLKSLSASQYLEFSAEL
jgi:hypothetical protein